MSPPHVDLKLLGSLIHEIMFYTEFHMEVFYGEFLRNFIRNDHEMSLQLRCIKVFPAEAYRNKQHCLQLI